MPGAFLHKKSLLDQFQDDYAMTDPIKARRTERSWGNPIVRHKREKGIQDWAKSFAGKRHYRKLMRFNAMRSEAYTEKTAWAYLEELEKLEGEDSRMEATEKVLRAAGCEPGTEGRWYGKDGDEVDIIDVLDSTEWAFAEKVCGQLQEAKKSETLAYEKGHKNSRGEDAPWVIRDHKGGKVLASFAKKADAEAHLERMQRYSKSEGAAGQEPKSESLKKNFRFKEPKSDDDLVAISDVIYEIYRRGDGQAAAEKVYSELESRMESASCDPRWNEMSDEACAYAMYKAAYPIVSKISAKQLEEIYFNPGYEHEYFQDVIEYDEEAEAPEYRTDDLYDFSSIRHESLKKALHESRVKKLERMGEAAKSYVLAHKGPNDTAYCKNKAGDWTTHIEDAWEGSGPDSFSAEMKRNFADVVHCDVEDLEVVPFEKFEAVDSVSKREIKAAVSSAWSSSGARDFELDIETDGAGDDVVRVKAMGPKGEDDIGIWWVISLPSLHADQYAAWDEKPYEQEPERSFDAKDLDDLEEFFLDEFKALQETIDTGKEN